MFTTQLFICDVVILYNQQIVILVPIIKFENTDNVVSMSSVVYEDIHAVWMICKLFVHMIKANANIMLVIR